MKVIIFGNSGSGKSTLAHHLSHQHALAHLDLDGLAWLPTEPPERRPLEESKRDIQAFIDTSPDWVIEGCYTDLLDMARPAATDAYYMDLSVELCLTNARQRPWEPHKYPSKSAQDKNLAMLERWIADYPHRDDNCSLTAHRQLFQRCANIKRHHLTSPPDL